MRYLSLFSGIEAASVAWNPLGWQCAGVAEVEPFPCAVLAHHYPDVPNLGDVTRFKEWPDAAFDVLVGGSPCQSFSVAGLRKGLDDPRGNLMLTYGAIAGKYRPRWLVWENVPGVLSSNGGRDFGTFLGMLGELGYGFAYRILDAQYLGVPQRRRRVFVVGCLGDWRHAAAVLFEQHSLSGNPPPSRKAGEGFARGAARSVAIRGREEVSQVELGDEVANAILTSSGGRCGIGVGAALVPANHVTHALTANGFDASEDGTGRGTPLVPIAFNARQDPDSWSDRAGPLDCDGGTQAIALIGFAVRRLTPTECERLQGFPDGYTAITVRGKPAADGPRYKALGNSMAVPVMAWIGRRIAKVNSIDRERIAA